MKNLLLKVATFPKNMMCKLKSNANQEANSCPITGCCKYAKCIMQVLMTTLIIWLLASFTPFFNFAVKRYLMNNPRTIIEAVENMVKSERQKKSEGSKDAVKAIAKMAKEKNDLPYVGNKFGSKVVVEFFDYNCPHCRTASHEIDKAISRNSDLKVTLVNTPILSEASLIAAKASIAVYDKYPQKFADFHHRLMSSQGKLDQKLIDMHLKSVLGDKFSDVQSYMNSKQVEEAVNNSYKMMESAGIQGAPAFIINDQLIPGAVNANELLQ